MAEFGAWIAGWINEAWVNSAVIGLSAVVALISLWRSQVINSRRATVDMVMQQMHNPTLIEANKIVNPILDEGKIIEYASDDKKDSKEREAILKVLNNHEFIAGAIKEGAFNYKLYQRMQHSKTVRDWKAFKPFVYHIRENTGRKTLFQDFEWLAKEFDCAPLKLNNKNQ